MCRISVGRGELSSFIKKRLPPSPSARGQFDSSPLLADLPDNEVNDNDHQSGKGRNPQIVPVHSHQYLPTKNVRLVLKQLHSLSEGPDCPRRKIAHQRNLVVIEVQRARALGGDALDQIFQLAAWAFALHQAFDLR